MKLLFDQNLSHKLVRKLELLFPGSLHVRDADMKSAQDPTVWEYARKQNFVIVSKDEDFHHLSFWRGAPPKVIGIDLGNCTTEKVEQLLRNRLIEIEAFEKDQTAAFLLLR